MERARLAAQAISDGLNCVYAIVETLRTDAPTNELSKSEWAESLDALVTALESTIKGEVWSSMSVSEEQMTRIRTARALVWDWVKSDHPPQELRPVAESVLRLFNL